MVAWLAFLLLCFVVKLAVQHVIPDQTPSVTQRRARETYITQLRKAGDITLDVTMDLNHSSA
jgi:hypothetical protein